MESCDSSPNYMRATSSSDAKKENSPGGSECDDTNSISSSNCGSSVNNTGIKYRTKNKNAIKNVRSFRRRAKSRMIQPSLETSYNSSSSHHESLVDESNDLKKTGGSRHYSRSNASCPSHKTLPALSRTSSIRNVRILIKKASFKPKRSSLVQAHLPENVTINRPTYSSTLKDSKFPEPVEIHEGGTESEGLSMKKICRYHHCSLHGHCHGPHDPVPPVKRFLYKRKLSLKKQKSMIPRNDSRPGSKRLSEKQKNVLKSPMSSVVDRSVREIKDGSSIVKGKKGMEYFPEISGKTEALNFEDGYLDIIESDLAEIAFGETSFPERSYEENLDILRNYTSDFGRPAVNGYCLKCSCSLNEQVPSRAKGVDVDLSMNRISPSSLANVDHQEVPKTVKADVSDSNSSTLFNKPVESVISNVEEMEKEICEDEGFDKDFPTTPAISDEITKKHGPFSSASESQISSGSNSDIEGEVKMKSVPSLNSEVSNVPRAKDDEVKFPIQTKLQFSKPRHISMWHLIHQHMSSGLATEVANKPNDVSDVENDQLHSADSQPNKESSESVKDSGEVAADNESDTQDIEIRKMFAIKLVREAIEKILLPEVQDQTSDDQSITSESTPRPIESTENKAFAEEGNVEVDVDKQGNAPSNPKEESPVTVETSVPEILKTDETIVRKSEKKAPKHWSNLKKWILLQRFIKELEKVKKFNPKKPRFLPLTPDPEAEKVNLRPQTLDERKKSEEWMLDYALRQAVGQLAPTQKRKVAWLVKAFETVVPPQEEPQVQFRIPSLIDIVNRPLSEDKKLSSSDGKAKQDGSESFSSPKSIKKTENAFDSDNVDGESLVMVQRSSDEKVGGIQANNLDLRGLLGYRTSDSKEDSKEAIDRRNHIKMWHMIYQHVVSGIAEKVGGQLLDESDDDDEKTPKSDFSSLENQKSSHQKSGFTKTDALKLVKEAVDEIMLPEAQDDSESSIKNEPQPPNAKNWNKLKKLLVLKRSIRALERARMGKPRPESILTQTSVSEPEKIDLRRQVMDERNKAEQWMLDYAVQHIVTKLTPARKRRVSMLVEAFEAVVPFPDV